MRLFDAYACNTWDFHKFFSGFARPKHGRIPSDVAQTALMR
jgi:hypothetical protein